MVEYGFALFGMMVAALAVGAIVTYFVMSRLDREAPTGGDAHMAKAVAGVVDRVLPNVLYIVLAIVVTTWMVLNHIEDAADSADWAKDLLIYVTGNVIGGLIAVCSQAFKKSE